MVGSRVGQTDQEEGHGAVMSHIDNNWQFSELMVSQGGRRIYIKNY